MHVRANFETKHNNIASAHTLAICLFISRFRSKQQILTNTELDKNPNEMREKNLKYDNLDAVILIFAPIEDRLCL